MKNNKPFEILLDSYSSESFNLYCVVRSLFDYPALDDNSEAGHYDGKLYATAFAYICSDFLTQYIEMYPHEDFELLIEELNFAADADLLMKDAIEMDYVKSSNFTDVVHFFLKDYRAKISSDIKTVFTTEKLQLNLFWSIFNMDIDNNFSPSNDTYTTRFLN